MSRIGRPFSWIYVAPLISFGVAAVLALIPAADDLEWKTLDLRTRLRATHFQGPPDSRVSIIGIGDRTTAELGPWPLRRSEHARLLKLLTYAHPRVVAWDVLFLDRLNREGEKFDPAADGVLAAATELVADEGAQVVTAGVSSMERVRLDRGPAVMPISRIEGDISAVDGDLFASLPFPELRAHATVGFVDAQRGPGGMVRELPLVVRIGGRVYASFALQTLLSYWGALPSDVAVTLGESIEVTTREGVKRIPVTAGGKLLLNYRYETTWDDASLGQEIATLEYLDVVISHTEYFERKTPGMRPPVSLENKIVLIGEFSTDAGPSPRAELSPLVLLHANAINSVLMGDFVRRASPLWIWVGGAVVGYVVVFGLRKSSVWMLVTSGFAIVTLYVFFCFERWIQASLWLPLVAPVVGFSILQFWIVCVRILEEQQAKEHVKRMFGSYLPPELLRQMIATGAQAIIGGARKPVTILFSDLRDFTRWTESTSEDIVIRQLNEYLDAMVRCIHQHDGALHKFIGDAVMAVWGDLVTAGPAEDACKAASAALAMHAALAELNERWLAAGLHPLRMGIGLNHGTVVVGNIGSTQRMEFTVIGDAVNLASRLEGLNKDLKTSTLIGESMRGFLENRFHLRSVGPVPVKGKSAPILVFELLPTEVSG